MKSGGGLPAFIIAASKVVILSADAHFDRENFLARRCHSQPACDQRHPSSLSRGSDRLVRRGQFFGHSTIASRGRQGHSGGGSALAKKAVAGGDMAGNGRISPPDLRP